MTIIDEAANARWPIDSAKVYHPPYLSDGGGCGGDYFAFWWKLDSNSKSYACNLARKPASCDKGQGPTGAFRGRCSDPDDRKNRYFDMVMTPNPIQNITPAKPRDTKAHKYDGIAWYQLTSNAKDVLGISGDISLKGVQFKNGALYSNGVYQENKARAFPKNWDLTRFSISAKFYVNDMNKSRPVFITAHRWLGYYLDKNGTISMKYNNSNMVTSNTRYKINTWHTASITYENGIAYFSLDGVQIGQKKIKFDFVNKNPTPSICITDFSNGATFKGWIKDLIVYRWN